jgi:4-diphosphocytidyl-2-C-methyl-D-erythritol kinase
MCPQAFFDVPAPAKLNLFLHVIGRRPDGYHLLQSAFVLIDWCDTLHFERNASGRLRRIDLGPPLPDEDLCIKAARLLREFSGTPQGADITIEKRIPSGAGLGGGSSDAASTLIALNRLWGLHYPRKVLLDLALKLGADVPFFVGGQNAWVEGIGEHLSPLHLPTGTFMVLKPPASIPTAAIFSNPLLPRDTKATTIAAFLEQPAGFGSNDLQACAEKHSPEVGQALKLLRGFGSFARMSGSGSAVFVQIKDASQEDLEAQKQLLVTLPSDWTHRVCQSLVAHPLRHWVDDKNKFQGNLSGFPV